MTREDRICAVAGRLVAEGPVTVDALLEALQTAGLRGLDHGAVWEIVTTKGIAELVGNTYVARAGAPTLSSGVVPAKTASPRALGDQRGGHLTPPSQLGRRSQMEVNTLRRSLDIVPIPGEHQSGPVPGSWPARAREMADAVASELRESSKRLSQLDVPVSDGRRIAKTESRVLYRFDVQGELPSGEGADVTFIPDGVPLGEQHSAEIVAVFGSDVTLALPPECPEVTSGRVRCDLTWLLVKQKGRLFAVADGAPGFNAAAALALTESFGAPAPELAPGTPLFVAATPDRSGLNLRQAEAVRAAQEHGTVWLWGPPGTGKTTTVAAIVETLAFTDGRRVLLVAPTNVAVDVAVGAVLRRLGRRRPGAVVRLGQPVDTSLIDHPDGRVLVDEVAAERGSQVAARRVEVGVQIAAARDRLTSLKQRPFSAELPRERHALEVTLSELTNLAHELDALLRELRRQVCRDARVVTSTTHQVLLGTLEGMPFDVVIIDEGSMVPTALAALVAGSGQGHTIVTGDFRQLPPVTIADTSAANRWLKRSPFESCGIPDQVAAGRPVPGLVALNDQHRMHASISDAVSAAFYPESVLRTADTVRRRPRLTTRPGWPDDPLVLVDTRSLRTRVSRRQGQMSRLNLAHAQLAAAIAHVTTEFCDDVAFISPFAPQARALDALAGDHVRASTVHRYQGSEADVVIFDAVDSTTSVGTLHPWFAEGELGSDGSRLVNVAASRARHQFVLLADVARVHHQRRSDDAIGRFLRQVVAGASTVEVRSLLGPTSPTQIAADPATTLTTALRGSGPVEMFLPAAVDVHRLQAVLRRLDGDRLEGATVWLAPEDADNAVGRILSKAGAHVRPLSPVRESLLVAGNTVVTASGSLLGPSTGTMLVTHHERLAETTRRLVRRRDTAGNPGSGRSADHCGRCGRLLVRIERTTRPPRTECLVCQPPRAPHRP